VVSEVTEGEVTEGDFTTEALGKRRIGVSAYRRIGVSVNGERRTTYPHAEAAEERGLRVIGQRRSRDLVGRGLRRDFDELSRVAPSGRSR
jgi:hypothetical protein